MITFILSYFRSFPHGRRCSCFEMATTEKETPAKKAAAPSVSQINAEYVTQVKLTIVSLNYTCGPELYVEILQSVLYIDPVSLYREH